jgi:hypothetical protein
MSAIQRVDQYLAAQGLGGMRGDQNPLIPMVRMLAKEVDRMDQLLVDILTETGIHRSASSTYDVQKGPTGG